MGIYTSAYIQFAPNKRINLSTLTHNHCLWNSTYQQKKCRLRSSTHQKHLAYKTTWLLRPRVQQLTDMEHYHIKLHFIPMNFWPNINLHTNHSTLLISLVQISTQKKTLNENCKYMAAVLPETHEYWNIHHVFKGKEK